MKNRWGNPYKISRTEARDWYHAAQVIPQGIRDGADNSTVVNNAGKYFLDNVIPEIYTDKMLEVIYRASGMPFSKMVDDMLLNWMGPGEKQGVCHMLVNDKRIRWVDDENI